MNDMEAGRALDARVAERVFGKVKCQAESHRNGDAPWPCHADPSSPDQGGETPCYSTDIAAAWTVVARIGGYFEINGEPGRVHFYIEYPGEDDERHGEAEASTFAEAVCRAALAATAASRAAEGQDE